jgi:hypothetical protein
MLKYKDKIQAIFVVRPKGVEAEELHFFYITVLRVSVLSLEGQSQNFRHRSRHDKFRPQNMNTQ